MDKRAELSKQLAICCLTIQQSIARFADMKTSLDLRIREQLNAKRGNWRELAMQSGISYSWLSKFARGCIENPGLRTLERLDAALRPDIFAEQGKEVQHG